MRMPTRLPGHCRCWKRAAPGGNEGDKEGYANADSIIHHAPDKVGRATVGSRHGRVLVEHLGIECQDAQEVGVPARHSPLTVVSWSHLWCSISTSHLQCKVIDLAGRQLAYIANPIDEG